MDPRGQGATLSRQAPSPPHMCLRRFGGWPRHMLYSTKANRSVQQTITRPGTEAAWLTSRKARARPGIDDSAPWNEICRRACRSGCRPLRLERKTALHLHSGQTSNQCITREICTAAMRQQAGIGLITVAPARLHRVRPGRYARGLCVAQRISKPSWPGLAYGRASRRRTILHKTGIPRGQHPRATAWTPHCTTIQAVPDRPEFRSAIGTQTAQYGMTRYSTPGSVINSVLSEHQTARSASEFT